MNPPPGGIPDVRTIVAIPNNPHRWAAHKPAIEQRVLAAHEHSVQNIIAGLAREGRTVTRAGPPTAYPLTHSGGKLRVVIETRLVERPGNGCGRWPNRCPTGTPCADTCTTRTSYQDRTNAEK